MVVRVPGASIGSAFPIDRLWHNGVTAIVRGLTAFDHSARAQRNAHAAWIELASARVQRQQVEAFLADCASTSEQPTVRRSS